MSGIDFEQRAAQGRELALMTYHSPDSKAHMWVSSAVEKKLVPDTPEGRERFAGNVGAVSALFHPDTLDVFPGEVDIQRVSQYTGLKIPEANATLNHLLEVGALVTRTEWQLQKMARELGRPLRGISGL